MDEPILEINLDPLPVRLALRRWARRRQEERVVLGQGQDFVLERRVAGVNRSGRHRSLRRQMLGGVCVGGSTRLSER